MFFLFAALPTAWGLLYRLWSALPHSPSVKGRAGRKTRGSENLAGSCEEIGWGRRDRRRYGAPPADRKARRRCSWPQLVERQSSGIMCAHEIPSLTRQSCSFDKAGAEQVRGRSRSAVLPRSRRCMRHLLWRRRRGSGPARTRRRCSAPLAARRRTAATARSPTRSTTTGRRPRGRHCIAVEPDRREDRCERKGVQVLPGVLLRPSDGALELAATDMELSLRTTLAASVEGDSSVVVPGKLLVDLARQMRTAPRSKKQRDGLTCSHDDRASTKRLARAWRTNSGPPQLISNLDGAFGTSPRQPGHRKRRTVRRAPSPKRAGLFRASGAGDRPPSRHNRRFVRQAGAPPSADPGSRHLGTKRYAR